MEERKKILMVTGSLRVGGMESVAMNIARYVDRNRFEINFVVYGTEIGVYEDEVRALGGEVFHLPFPREGFVKYCRALKEVINHTGPYDVVHSHSLFPSGMIMKVAYESGIPIRIAHAHTNRDDSHLNIIRRIYQRRMREYMWKYATNFFACSNKSGNYLFQEKFKNKGFVMNNGVSTEKFMINEETKEKLRTEFGIKDEKVVGHTGRFDAVKNHSLLIDIFVSILKTGKKAKLMLIGDGPLRSSIEEKIKNYGIEDKVILTGMRSDVPALLSLMDVFVLPSTYEGVSVSLIEAQAAGVPYVVSTTAYSDESKVTEYGVAVDLHADVTIWRDVIIQQMKRRKFANAKKIVYDTGSVVKYVEDHYYSSVE